MARPVTITTLSFTASGAKTVADSVSQAIQWIDLAACDKPDLMVLPEAFAAGNEQCARSKELFCASAEPIDGQTVTRLAQRAAEHGCYIAAPVVLQRGAKRTNSIVLLDRGGEIAGIYDKCFPPVPELEQGPGVTPGDGPVTVDTDFGKVGMLICFDLNFDELRRQYLAASPQLLVFCSMFQGGMIGQMWALLNGCYFASSYPGDGSVIINPLGRVLARSNVPNSRIMTRRINLDYQVLHLDYNQLKLNDLRRKYGAVIDVELTEGEGRLLLSCNDEQLTADDICRDLDLELVEDFLARSRAACKQSLSSGPPLPGPPAW